MDDRNFGCSRGRKTVDGLCKFGVMGARTVHWSTVLRRRLRIAWSGSCGGSCTLNSSILSRLPLLLGHAAVPVKWYARQDLHLQPSASDCLGAERFTIRRSQSAGPLAADKPAPLLVGLRARCYEMVPPVGIAPT
jgi:hypothetical protein